MSDADVHALRRAALVLLLVSAVRWAYERAPHGSAPSVDVAASQAAAAREALEADERRTRPLADGERIDPNRASAEELDRLPGIGPAKARAIVAARDSGVTFVQAEDLTRVPGIGPATVERLVPHLEVPPAAAGRSRTGRGRAEPGGAARAPRPPLDLNRATEAELRTLPGIGPVTASKILEARKGRPFSSLDDLRRVPGIGPATVERLRTLATAGRAGR